QPGDRANLADLGEIADVPVDDCGEVAVVPGAARDLRPEAAYFRVPAVADGRDVLVPGPCGLCAVEAPWARWYCLSNVVLPD
ncbi:MAG TPA: hypothetical protein VMA95_13705, partial [Streptosporangiaceae bacterium]|nr:hypothetical protein [Streptosporangiaceae bacterium]